MSYKNLPLDRSLIDNALRDFNSSIKFTSNVKGTKQSYEISIEGEQKAALVHFFFNGNGKTTIQFNQGRNTPLGERIAEHIVKTCSIVVASKENLSIKDLDDESFGMLCEYLQDCCGCHLSEVDFAQGKRVTARGGQGDNITLTYYKTKTFIMQGTPLMVHSQVIEFLSNVCDLEDVIESQLAQIKVDITPNQVFNDMSCQLPTSFNELDNTVKALISPSVALLKLDIQLTDYTVLAFPALRGLEGYIKYLFSTKGIVIGRDGFAEFLNNEYYTTLSDSARKQIGCDKTCTAINKCYSFYRNERHGLFHANGFLANTRMLDTKRDAESIVNGVLNLIEESHCIIRS